MSDPGQTITKEVRAGAVITAVIVLLVAFLVAYGKFARAVSSSREVRVVFASVANMRSEAKVYYNGLQIGKVGRIQLLEMNEQSLAELPSFSDRDLPFLPFSEDERAAFKETPADQINAEIRKRLIGKSMVELLLDIVKEDDKKRFHDDDQVRLGSTLMGESSVQIFAGTGKPIDAAKAKVFMGEGGDMYSSLANALDQVKNILETAADMMGGGDQSPMAKKIAGLDEFTENLENRAGNLETNASQLLTKADTRLDEAREAFTGLDTAVQNLKPELSKTLDNAQTQLDTVRQNVARVTQNGKKTIQDVRNNFIADLVEIAKQMKERRGAWPTLVHDAREWTDSLKPKVDGMNAELEALSQRLKTGTPEVKSTLAGYSDLVNSLEEKTWYYAHYPWLAFNNPTEDDEKDMLYERRKDLMIRRFKEMRPQFEKAFAVGAFDPARKAQAMAIVAEMDDYLLGVPKGSGRK